MIQQPDPAEILSLFNTFKDQNSTVDVKEFVQIIQESSNL
jgi:Ca2+-binding EF-hand superfamily protein